MANRKLVIEVVGDASKLDKTFKQAATSTNRFGKALDGINTGRATSGLSQFSALTKGGAIAVGLGIATKQAIQFGEAASDLNEQISKSRQVFGTSSTQVEEWSKTTATALGISRTAALEAAGTFGNLFSTVKLAPQQAASMSRALVQLASDLASFNNADPSEVLEALRSGLIGEAEPLRRFGVLLSEARVQQRAMADTGKDTAKSLTDQEKTIARYELILADTTKAQGDFARTSDGLANQQRALKAQLADLETTLGKGVVPALTTATKTANEFVTAAGHLGSALSAVGVHASDVGKSIGAAFAATPGLQVVIGEVKLINKLFGDTKDSVDATAESTRAFAKALDDAAKPAAFLSTFKIPELPKIPKRPDEGTRGPGPTIPSFGQPGFKLGTAPAVPLGPTAEQRNRFFDDLIGRKIDRVQDVESLSGQVSELRKIEGLIQDRIDITKDITRKLNLEDTLVRVRRQEKSVLEAISEKAAEDARKAAEKAREAREHAKKQRASLIDAGNTVVSGFKNFQRIIKGAEQKTDGPLTKTTALNVSKALSGLSLSRDDERELRARLSHFNSAGKALAGGAGAEFGGGTSTATTNVTVNLDGQKVGSIMARRQQRNDRSNPRQKRGNRH